MQHQIQHFGGRSPYGLMIPDAAGAVPATPLLLVLWRRRWTLALTALACVVAAGAYLALAPRVYTSAATVMIQQNGPKAFSESQGYQAGSETFMQTQADVFRSTPVLARALESINYRTLK